MVYTQVVPIKEKPPGNEVYNYADSFWCTYVVSVVAASVAEIREYRFVSFYSSNPLNARFSSAVTYPLDLTKTRLQIQGELATANKPTQHRGMFKTAIGIVNEEGALKLWQGVPPALYRHVIYSGIRIVSYEKMRDKILLKNEDGSFPIWWVFTIFNQSVIPS